VRPDLNRVSILQLTLYYFRWYKPGSCGTRSYAWTRATFLPYSLSVFRCWMHCGANRLSSLAGLILLLFAWPAGRMPMSTRDAWLCRSLPMAPSSTKRSFPRPVSCHAATMPVNATYAEPACCLEQGAFTAAPRTRFPRNLTSSSLSVGRFPAAHGFYITAVNHLGAHVVHYFRATDIKVYTSMHTTSPPPRPDPAVPYCVR
jgi:hypothetical protein